MPVGMLPVVKIQFEIMIRSIILAITASAVLLAGGMLAGAQTTLRATPRDGSVSPVASGYRMSGSPSVEMKLEGTTPISTWQMSAHGISGIAQISVTRDGTLAAINALTFELPVRNLKGESGAMDDHAYTALKADQYKDITFHLASATIAPGKEGYLVEAAGTLTVAGVIRPVTLAMHGSVNSDGTITFRGAENLRMSDYSVERPSLLFGMIKARDEMTLTYTLIFSK